MDFEGFLDLLLHVVAVLLQLRNNLLLSIGTLFRRPRLLFQSILQVADLLLMRLRDLRNFLARIFPTRLRCCVGLFFDNCLIELRLVLKPCRLGCGA